MKTEILINKRAKQLAKKLKSWDFEKAIKYAYRDGMIDELKDTIKRLKNGR